MNFQDERHALYVGWILGLAMKHGIPLQPEVDGEGNYMDRLRLDLTDKTSLTLVVPPPPDDWEFKD